VPVDLAALFRGVRESADASPTDRLAAVPIPGFPNHRVARTREGWPVLLLACRDRDYRNYSAPVRLENLSVQYAVPCRVSYSDGHAEEGNFTVVMCSASDSAVDRQFLAVAGLLVDALGSNPSRLDVTRNVEALVELFRVLSEPPRKTVQGLWAELFLIARSSHPAELVAAWHVQPEDRFDFSSGNQRIEVKAAAGRERHHHFSLEQLQSLPNADVVIASVFIERSGAGVSLHDLMDTIRSRLVDQPALSLRVEITVAASLGDHLRRSMDDAFDRQLAEESLHYYHQHDVPVIGAVPPGVSHVHFRADLEGINPVEFNADAPGLFAALSRQAH
jgi:hypothetical protein